MQFRDFIQEDDATKSYAFMYGGEKKPNAFASTGTFHEMPDTILNNKVVKIVSAVQKLDPFIRKRGQTVISGTPDFMSPEQSRGVVNDQDWMTYFYQSTARKHPGLAAMLKPVVSLCQVFLSNVLKLMNDQHENVEMETRLDLRNFEGVKNAMETIHKTLGQVKPEELKASPTLAAVISSFTPFYAKFSVISAHVSEYLNQQYQNVQHLKWDKT